MPRKITSLQGSALPVCRCGGLNQAKSAEAFWSMFEELSWAKAIAYFGNAEALNLVLLPSLLAARPLTKVVWIDRSLSESIKSAADCGLRYEPRFWQGVLELRDRYVQHFDLVLPFKELAEEDGIRALWQTVLPGVPFNRRRWEAFARKRIVCDREKARTRDFNWFEQFLHTEAEDLILPPL